MDKLIRVVNCLLIVVYVATGILTLFLFLFRSVNNEVGLEWLTLYAPYIVGVVVFGIMHFISYTIYENGK